MTKGEDGRYSNFAIRKIEFERIKLEAGAHVRHYHLNHSFAKEKLHLQHIRAKAWVFGKRNAKTRFLYRYKSNMFTTEKPVYF